MIVRSRGGNREEEGGRVGEEVGDAQIKIVMLIKIGHNCVA